MIESQKEPGAQATGYYGRIVCERSMFSTMFKSEVFHYLQRSGELLCLSEMRRSLGCALRLGSAGNTEFS